MAKRIVIPSNNGLVNPHFGRSNEFTVFEIVEKQAKEFGKLSAAGLEHNHEGLAELFQRHKISVLVCGGIGSGMIDRINEAGMDIVTGATGGVHDVARTYAEGTLISSDSTCHEHHHRH